MAKCFIPYRGAYRGSRGCGKGSPLLSEQRKETITKTGGHFSRMKKKSLLSVVGTRPDPSQVALEVIEAGPGRSGAKPPEVKGHVESLRSHPEESYKPKHQVGPAGSQGDTGTDVQCPPASLGSDGFLCSSAIHQRRTFLNLPASGRARVAGGLWRAAPATPQEL